MADIENKENREDQKIKECLQDAYGYSDAQLLKELEQAEKSVSDSDFPGAEDRIFQKLMERQAAQERKNANMEDNPENTKNNPALEGSSGEGAKGSPALEGSSGEIPKISSVLEESSEGNPETKTLPGRGVVRLKKKKMFFAAVLVALFAGLLGITAIGGKNYFFRGRETSKGMVFNNDEPIIKEGNLDAAYEEAKEQLDIKIMKLGYIPENMIFKELYLGENTATFEFKYGKETIYFIQEQGLNEVSLGINSDREASQKDIFNRWIGKEVYINEETLENGEDGYAAIVTVENAIYRLIGKIKSEELEKIVENLNFY